MADRQWMGWNGGLIHEEGNEEFVTWSGIALSEDQAEISSFLSGNFIISGNISINKN